MDGPRRRSRSAVLSPPPEVIAVEFDSSRPDSRRPVVTYRVLGQDEGLVPQNSWNRVKRFQPSMSAFFRWEPLAVYVRAWAWAWVSIAYYVERREEVQLSGRDSTQPCVLLLLHTCHESSPL